MTKPLSECNSVTELCAWQSQRLGYRPENLIAPKMFEDALTRAFTLGAVEMRNVAAGMVSIQLLDDLERRIRAISPADLMGDA